METQTIHACLRMLKKQLSETQYKTFHKEWANSIIDYPEQNNLEGLADFCRRTHPKPTLKDHIIRPIDDLGYWGEKYFWGMPLIHSEHISGEYPHKLLSNLKKELASVKKYFPNVKNDMLSIQMLR